MIFKNRCYNGGNKHKFRARYSEESSGIKCIPAERFLSAKVIHRLLYCQKYECDICEWCGKIIKNEVKK
jgi:hypothetical protein